MPECAYCSYTGRLTKEHIFSKWMSKVLAHPTNPRNARRPTRMADTEGVNSAYLTREIDLAPRVVCDDCNGTWMSNIENKYAKPYMTPLILGKEGITVDSVCARAIALFAFNTAVSMDYSMFIKYGYKGVRPSFPRSVRHAFRESLQIPPNVQMWMFSRAGDDLGVSYYGEDIHTLSASKQKGHIHVSTCGIGKFGFQVVSVIPPIRLKVIPSPGFEHLCVPFWPDPIDDFSWPVTLPIPAVQEFVNFSRRWESPKFSLP
jgi:hypothetical protein